MMSQPSPVSSPLASNDDCLDNGGNGSLSKQDCDVVTTLMFQLASHTLHWLILVVMIIMEKLVFEHKYKNLSMIHDKIKFTNNDSSMDAC